MPSAARYSHVSRRDAYAVQSTLPPANAQSPKSVAAQSHAIKRAPRQKAVSAVERTFQLVNHLTTDGTTYAGPMTPHYRPTNVASHHEHQPTVNESWVSIVYIKHARLTIHRYNPEKGVNNASPQIAQALESPAVCSCCPVELQSQRVDNAAADSKFMSSTRTLILMLRSDADINVLWDCRFFCCQS
jgi:hypothetical protein